MSSQSNVDSSSLIYASDILVLSTFTTEADATLMDEVHSSVKIDFMNDGLMIGQFHPYRDTPGLHNKEFFPHRCPAFCFAIRNMISSDHVFIDQNLPAERIPFAAQALLARFGTVLPPDVLRKVESM